MPKYLTVVMHLADNADQNLVLDQMERINGATLSAAASYHALDERDRYHAALDRIRLEDLCVFDCKLIAAKAQGIIP
jgi:hypothetical protein